METIQQAGDRLHGALFGKNKEEIVLDIIMNNDLGRRLQISKYYFETYTKELYEDMKDKLSGNFKELAGHSFLSPFELRAKLLKKGFRKTDESVIFEIFSSLNQDEFRQLEEAFKKETGNDLTKAIEKTFSGTMRKNLLNLMYTPRRVNPNPNKEQCEEYANTLVQAGENNWAGDENVFRDIFITCSPEELVMIGRFYLKITQKNMLDVIEKKLSGKAKNLLKEVLFNNIIPHELYAEKIYLSIKGLGTDTTLLNRVLVTRNQIDMDEIREMYQWKYKVTMKEDIVGDTSGNYLKLCLYLGHC